MPEQTQRRCRGGKRLFRCYGAPQASRMSGVDTQAPPAAAGTSLREEEKSLELSHQLFPRSDPAVRVNGQRTAFAPKLCHAGAAGWAAASQKATAPSQGQGCTGVTERISEKYTVINGTQRECSLCSSIGTNVPLLR